MRGPYTARAAERCLWKEEFTNAATVHRNGGTLVGTPVIKSGAHLDGTSQAVTYALDGSELGTKLFSAVCEFTPDFDWDEDVTRFLFSSAAPGRYSVEKRNTAGSHIIVMYLGNTFIASIASAVYAAYWRVGERNRLVISSDGATYNIWLNGTSIAAGAAAWTPYGAPVQLAIGVFPAGAQYFDGIARSLSFHGLLITQADVDAMEAGSLWTYRQRSSLYLDFKEATAKAGTIRGSAEELVNGDFTAWTGGTYPDPDGWAVISPDTSANHIEEDPTGQAHFVSDGAYVGISQNTLVVGKRYRCVLVVTAVVSGTGAVSGTGNYLTFTTPGTYDFVFIADSIALALKRNTACDFTVDSISVVETDELLDDARMEATGVGEWAVGSGALLSKEGDPYEGLQCLRITKDAATQDWTSQNVTDIGRLYHVVGVARGDGTIAPSVGNGTTYQWTGTISTAWQLFDFWWIDPTGSGLYLYASAGGGAGNFVEFDAVSVRPVLSRTLDKSRHGRVCLLGDGFTAASIPDFKAPGFGLDGVANYLSMPNAAGIFDTIGQTIAVVIRPGFPIVDGINHYILDSTDGARYRFLKADDDKLYVYMGNTQFPAIATAVLVQHWRTNGVNVLVVASESGDTSMWLNNNLILDSDTTVWTPSDPAEIFLGTIHSGGGYFDGEYDGFMDWPEKLPPLAVRDLTLQPLGGV